jgi:hypothetical protein
LKIETFETFGFQNGLCRLKRAVAAAGLARGITPAVEAAQKIMLRGLTEKEAKELVRLLQKAIPAGDDLSRAPLRDAATSRPALFSSKANVRIRRFPSP